MWRDTHLSRMPLKTANSLKSLHGMICSLSAKHRENAMNTWILRIKKYYLTSCIMWTILFCTIIPNSDLNPAYCTLQRRIKKQLWNHYQGLGLHPLHLNSSFFSCKESQCILLQGNLCCTALRRSSVISLFRSSSLFSFEKQWEVQGQT